MTLQTDELILVVDDDPGFIESLRNQAHAADIKQQFIFLCYGDSNFIDILQNHAHSIAAVFLDFDMGSEYTPKRIMDTMAGYLDWRKIRVFWFSGEDSLNTAALQCAREDYPTLSAKYLRKPLTVSDLSACLSENFKPAEQWQYFPWPLRVINKQGQVVYKNQHWLAPDNLPVPASFVNNKIFLTEMREFFNQLPNSSEGEAGYFRLWSFPVEEGRYLLQYAENITPSAPRANWLSVVEKIAAALVEMGYTRVRFCRYLNVPRHYENDGKTHDLSHGVLALCWSNTTLNDGKPVGKRDAPKRVPMTEPLLGRMKKLVADYDNPECNGKIIFHIADSSNRGEDQEWDDLIIPNPNETQGYSIVELPLFTENDEVVSIIGNPRLLGKLTFDRYNENTDSFIEITEQDINRLQKTLYNFCKELATVMELDIKQTSKNHALAYVELDNEMAGGIDKPEELLKKLLDHAVEDVKASNGYITERDVSGYRVTISLGKELFQDALFKDNDQTKQLPVVHSWQRRMTVSLPDIKSEHDILSKWVQAYDDPECVAFLGEGVENRNEWKHYIGQAVGSLLVLPVMAGDEQIAAIVLHSNDAYHFDDERLERLKHLTTRASWLLAVSRHIDQRKLFLDGVMHEIKSDVTPLHRYLSKLTVSADTKDYWQRCRYSATRLEMAAKNLLRLTESSTEMKLPIDPSAQCNNMAQILQNLCDIYQLEMSDRNLRTEFDPGLDDPKWLTQLPISEERFTHIAVNLLDNAVKHSKEGGYVRISGVPEKRNGRAGFKLKMANFGAIPEPARLQAFNTVYHSGRSDGFHVGLASCKQLMELHSGEISLESSKKTNQVIATVWWPLGEKQ